MASITYSVSFQGAKAHYVDVVVKFNAQSAGATFKVPVWTPGSYKIREFSQNVEDVQAKVEERDESNSRMVSRRDKNSWVIDCQEGDAVQLSYRVYCFVNSVRHSYVDEYYAFLHGVSAFGYIEGMKDMPIELELMPNETWGNVEMAAEKIVANRHVFKLDNYDHLADSPIALGNFDIVEYRSGNVPHKVVMMGEGNYDLEKIKVDFKKISDVEIDLFGEHPSPSYIHFIQNTSIASGGLEHMNSQTSQMDRWGYDNPERYTKFLGLISHEYFHLWNVKRIRPLELGPFDYDRENYSDMLWIAEGITSYYDDLFLYRAGLLSQEEYFTLLAKQINRYENTPGKDFMNLVESSRLAWVKTYLPNENSDNKTISYYNKGMLVAWMLDLYLLENSKGKKGLDELMRMLWQHYKEDPNKGFSKSEFIAICSELAGHSMEPFFEVLMQTGELNYNHLETFGLTLEDQNQNSKPWTGISSAVDDGKIVVKRIVINSPAEKAGLAVNDELIAQDGWRLSEAIEIRDEMNIGDRLTLTISRDGKILDKVVELQPDPQKDYRLQITSDSELRDCWLEI